MNFLRRLFRVEPKLIVRHKTHLVTGTSLGLGLRQWQSDEKLVIMARDIHADRRFQAMLDVNRTESPANWIDGNTSPERALGRIEGYQMCLNNFEAMTKRAETPEHLEATFEAPEPINEETKTP